MKIRLGEFVVNKTKEFLFPCLREYGNEFISVIGSLYKLGVGIGDIILIKNGFELDKHILLLVDTNFVVKTEGVAVNDFGKNFIKSLKWLKTQYYYTNDYAYDDLQFGKLHMILIKIPDTYFDAYEKFIQNKFSEMYSEDQLNMFLNNEILQVLKQDEKYKIEFVNKLNQIYGTNVKSEDFDGELTMPILEQNEIFNFHLVGGK